MNDAERQRIEAAWISRADFQALKPHTAAYRKAEAEFFVGAMTAAQSMPPQWVLAIMRGEPVTNQAMSYTERLAAALTYTRERVNLGADWMKATLAASNRFRVDRNELRNTYNQEQSSAAKEPTT